MKDAWIFAHLPGVYVGENTDRFTLEDWEDCLDAINVELNAREFRALFSKSAKLQSEIAELKHAQRKLKSFLARQKRKQAK